jgi:hypothetical protein
LPRGTPPRYVSIAEINSRNILFSQLKGTSPLKSAMEVGIPPPLQLGAIFKISADSRAITVTPAINSGRYTGFDLTKAYTFSDREIMAEADILNKKISAPVSIPVITENTRQGMRIFFI